MTSQTDAFDRAIVVASNPVRAAGSSPLGDWLAGRLRTFVVTYGREDTRDIRLTVNVASADDIAAVGDARTALVDAIGWDESAEWTYLRTDVTP